MAEALTREEAATQAPGKARVRQILIEPLEQMGLRRPKGAKAGDHAERVERLVERLAYMSPPGLQALLAALERLAGGALGNEWPSDLVVLRVAWGIEPPPPALDRLFTSYLASAAGQRAWAESPQLAAELATHLATRRRPPLDHEWDGMRARASARRRELLMAARRETEGRASEADAQDLARWRREVTKLRALVLGQTGEGDDAGVSDAA